MDEEKYLAAKKIVDEYEHHRLKEPIIVNIVPSISQIHRHGIKASKIESSMVRAVASTYFENGAKWALEQIIKRNT